MTGRIDVHSHLLPGIDDGCQTIAESIACAKILVENGYTHAFCTPHIWPSLPHNTPANIVTRVSALQAAFDEQKIPLKLFPGGELNLRRDLHAGDPQLLASYAMAGKVVLIDLWADAFPTYLKTTMRWFDSLGLKVILAHPERMRLIQDDPPSVERFTEFGIRLQCNLQCLGDPPRSATRQTAERYLQEDRYFMVGSDLHNPQSLPVRVEGLRRLTELVSTEKLDVLTRANPATLLPSVC